MIKKSIYVLITFSALSFFSCKQQNKSVIENADVEQDALKNISELTYAEIFYLLHDEDEYGMDVHGDLFGMDAVGHVSLSIGVKSQCGDAVLLESTHSTQNIKVAVKTTFNLPGNPANEIYRAYVIKPGESHPVGHTVLCYEGTEYVINREIASAGFTDEN